jgi:hypothetical protein
MRFNRGNDVRFHFPRGSVSEPFYSKRVKDVETFWFHELSGRFPRNRPIKAESWENCAELLVVRQSKTVTANTSR